MILLSSCTIDWNEEKAPSICKQNDISCILQNICDTKRVPENIAELQNNIGAFVRQDNSLFYAQSTNGSMYVDFDFNNTHKGYIYIFKRYNCMNHENEELV